MYRRTTRTLRFHSLEVLDDRIVPSTTASAVAADEALVSLKGGQALGTIYQEYSNYEAAGGQGPFQSVEAGQVIFSPTSATSVGVDIRFSGGNFNTLISELQGIGMQVTATDAQEEIVEGYLPIAQLPVVASNGYESSLAPIYKPSLNNSPTTTTSINQTIVTSKGGATLGSIYSEYLSYEQAGSPGTFSPSQAGQIYFSGTSVGVNITFDGGNYNTLVSELHGIGFVETASLPQYGFVEGYLPIAQLPVVSSNGYVASISPVSIPGSTTTTSTTTTTDQTIVETKGGQALGTIYSQYLSYQQSGSQGTFTSTEASQIYISGTSVGVDIRFSGGNFNTLVAELKGIGFVETASLPQDNLVEGYLPIAQLPVVASNGYVSTLAPVYRPGLN